MNEAEIAEARRRWLDGASEDLVRELRRVRQRAEHRGESAVSESLVSLEVLVERVFRAHREEG